MSSSEDQEHWRRVEALREALRHLAPDEARAYLARATANEPELRRDVEALVNTDYVDEVETAVPPPGGRKAGPYALRRPIGAGGMGVVYEAEDTRLGRRVALKFLPFGFGTASPRAKERFFREAKFISSLDHPAICTIHDIGEAEDGQLYFVMPYYPGETLRARVVEGPLPIEEARAITIQLAQGLAHAHERGITHRDIKPANVMLTDAGQAKLLDFGVAREADAATITRKGAPVGTPAYMSPEQSRGEPADARSDLWSLGVMLYEMLAAKRPFAGGEPLAVMNAIATEEPVPVTELRPDVPPELAAVVTKLLAKDPAKRPASARQLLIELGGETSTSVPIRAPEGKQSRRLGVAAIVGVIMLGALALPWSRRMVLDTFSPSPVSGPELVAVLPLVNNVGPAPENQALADGLTHSITGMIARMGAAEDRLWVVPASEVAQRGVATASEARELFGVDTVLTGSVHSVAGITEIVMTVIDPTVNPPRTIDSRDVTAPVSPELRDAALRELAELMNISEDARASAGIDSVETASPEAYRHQLRGLGYLQRSYQSGNVDAAVEAFREALAADPGYGSAHAGLCQALWEKHFVVSEPGLASEAQVACKRASELASSDPSVLVALGRSFLEQGETRKAKEELQRALSLEPKNAEAHRWLGWAASDEGNGEQAVASMQEAIALEPKAWLYHWDLGEVLLILGRNEEALAQFERSRAITPENYLVYNALAVAHSELGHVEEADRLFRRAIELRPNPMAYRNLGYQRYRDQRYRDAVDELERARDLLGESPSPSDWIVWSWLAHAYYWAGDRDDAQAAWRHLVGVATPLYEINPRDPDVLMLLSDAHVALGDLERGRFYLNRLLALPLDAVYLRYYIGRIYEMTGDRELALTYITQALEQRFDPLFVDRDPWLEELRRDPDYRILRQQYLPAVR